MKFIQYYSPEEHRTRLYITDSFDVGRNYLAMGYLYLNACHNGDIPESSMFYGQEMSLVDNYDERIDEKNLMVSSTVFPEFINTITAIIRSGRSGEEKMKAKLWDIIWGEKNEDGNW